MYLHNPSIPAAVRATVEGWHFGESTAEEVCTVKCYTAGEAHELLLADGEDDSLLAALDGGAQVWVVRDDRLAGVKAGFEARMVSVLTADGREVYGFTA